MGSETKFDLDAAVEAWRAALFAAGVKPDEADELQSHLLEAAAAGVASGLDREAAFSAAKQGLGTPALLAGDFERARALNERIAQRIMGSGLNIKSMLVGALAVVAVVFAFDSEPQYQMVATDRAVLRLDTETGDVCTVVVYVAMEGNCLTAEGQKLAANEFLEGDFVLDFAGNLVRRPETAAKPAKMSSLETKTEALVTLVGTASIREAYALAGSLGLEQEEVEVEMRPVRVVLPLFDAPSTATTERLLALDGLSTVELRSSTAIGCLEELRNARAAGKPIDRSLHLFFDPHVSADHARAQVEAAAGRPVCDLTKRANLIRIQLPVAQREVVFARLRKSRIVAGIDGSLL